MTEIDIEEAIRKVMDDGEGDDPSAIFTPDGRYVLRGDKYEFTPWAEIPEGEEENF